MNDRLKLIVAAGKTAVPPHNAEGAAIGPLPLRRDE